MSGAQRPHEQDPTADNVTDLLVCRAHQSEHFAIRDIALGRRRLPRCALASVFLLLGVIALACLWRAPAGVGPGRRHGARAEWALISEGEAKRRRPQESIITWAAHSNKCVDVEGGWASNGNVLQVWDCNDHDDMTFSVPLGETGAIRWTAHPEFCLDAPEGHKLQLWHCEKSINRNMLFQVPADGEGGIRLAKRPDWCLGVKKKKGDVGNGVWLQVWDCADSTADTDLKVLPKRHKKPVPRCRLQEWSEWSQCSRTCGGGTRLRVREAHRPRGAPGCKKKDKSQQQFCNTEKCRAPLREAYIAWAKSPEKCLDVADGHKTNGGNTPRMWDCRDHPHMTFRVPIGGAGPIRWSAHPELCLDAPGGPALQLWKCDENNKNMVFSVPEGGTGKIRLDHYPDRCLSVPSGPEKSGLELQVRDCAEGAPDDHDFTAKILCEWGAWSDWSECSEMCGHGTHTRTRTVAQQPSAGQRCNGGRSQSRSCRNKGCEVPPELAVIRWVKHPEKCLGANAGQEHKKHALSFNDCEGSPNRFFTVPAGGPGVIRWAKDPNLCLDAPGGPNLILAECGARQQENMLFKLPAGDSGHIELASYADTCLSASDDGIGDGSHWLQIWTCTEGTVNMEFIVEFMCKWGEWSDWSRCSASCGAGTMKRTRTLLSRAKAGGEGCEASQSEVANCSLAECKGQPPDAPPPAHS